MLPPSHLWAHRCDCTHPSARCDREKEGSEVRAVCNVFIPVCLSCDLMFCHGLQVPCGAFGEGPVGPSSDGHGSQGTDSHADPHE